MGKNVKNMTIYISFLLIGGNTNVHNYVIELLMNMCVTDFVTLYYMICQGVFLAI